ncbi:MAG: 3-hydroxyacyl-CoA dehydrogenase, partial [Polaromonas sp.]|nr:3-hydroxyacyl-CoA dehydrogenase [Polaromonas sp.]
MNIQGHAAIVTGGASGLGEATARELARLGAKVALLDVNYALAQQVAADIGADRAIACACDITDTDSVTAALAQAAAAHGPARILMNIAGMGSAKRVVQKDGSPAPLEDFARVITINLIGSYNVSRLFAAACAKLAPLDDGERGVMMFTASVAAFDGQVGQQAYSAS